MFFCLSSIATIIPDPSFLLTLDFGEGIIRNPTFPSLSLSLTFPIFKEKFVSGENGHWIKSFRDYTLLSIQIILFFYLLELIEFGWSNLELIKRKKIPFCALFISLFMPKHFRVLL